MSIGWWCLLAGCSVGVEAPPPQPGQPLAAPVPFEAPAPTLASWPTIQGVGIGSTIAQLEAALGPPLQVLQLPYEASQDMGLGPQQRATWTGLEVGLSQPEGAPAPVAWTWTITGATAALTPKVAVGDSEAQLLAAMGPASETASESGVETRVWRLAAVDGHFWAVLRDGVVVELRAAEDWS